MKKEYSCCEVRTKIQAVCSITISETEVWGKIYLKNEQGQLVMRFIYEAVRVNNEELVKKQNFYQNVRKER